MSKDWGTYRKLYESLPPAFERLPYATRCLSADILRRCDRVGRIIPGKEFSDSLVADLAFHVRAHTGEYEFLYRSLEGLLNDEYLVFRDGYLCIRNFVEAQRSEAADRMAKKRARDAEPSPEPGYASDERDVTASQPVTLHARASSDFVSSGLDQGSGSQKSESTRKSRSPAAANVPVELSEDWMPEADQIAAVAQKHQVSEARLRAGVPEFRWYWRKGKGAGSKKSPRGWAQTWGNRADADARSGALYAEPRAFQGAEPRQSEDARKARARAILESARRGDYGPEAKAHADSGKNLGKLIADINGNLIRKQRAEPTGLGELLPKVS